MKNEKTLAAAPSMWSRACALKTGRICLGLATAAFAAIAFIEFFPFALVFDFAWFLLFGGGIWHTFSVASAAVSLGLYFSCVADAPAWPNKHTNSTAWDLRFKHWQRCRGYAGSLLMGALVLAACLAVWILWTRPYGAAPYVACLALALLCAFAMDCHENKSALPKAAE